MIYVKRLHVETNEETTGDNCSSLNEADLERAVLGIQGLLELRTENFVTLFFVTKEEPKKRSVTGLEPDLMSIDFQGYFIRRLVSSELRSERFGLGIIPGFSRKHINKERSIGGPEGIEDIE